MILASYTDLSLKFYQLLIHCWRYSCHYYQYPLKEDFQLGTIVSSYRINVNCRIQYISYYYGTYLFNNRLLWLCSSILIMKAYKKKNIYVLISIIVAVCSSASGIVTIYSPHFVRMIIMKLLNLLWSIFPYMTMSLYLKSLRFTLLCHIGRRIIHGTVQIQVYDFPTPIWSNSSLIKGLVM